MGRKYLFLVTAVTEGATGAALVVIPAPVFALLLGVSSAAPEALLVGRVAGGALLAIAVACWTVGGDAAHAPQRGVVAAVLVYDVIAATVLAGAGTTAGMVGIALWPAVAAHVGLAGWCIVALLRERPGRPGDLPADREGTR